jgi:hypothetical protein
MIIVHAHRTQYSKYEMQFTYLNNKRRDAISITNILLCREPIVESCASWTVLIFVFPRVITAEVFSFSYLSSYNIWLFQGCIGLEICFRTEPPYFSPPPPQHICMYNDCLSMFSCYSWWMRIFLPELCTVYCKICTICTQFLTTAAKQH